MSEKKSIYVKKRRQENVTNVGGENAAKIAGKEIRQNVSNLVKSWCSQTRRES